MSEEKKDRELGMKCPISRRDFLNGVAVGVGGALAGETLLAAGVVDGEEVGRARDAAGAALGADGGDEPQKAAGYYPPALTGMRGNHDGSFTYAHGLRDGKKWDAGGPATKVDETYDLVVVGGGISGLASAYFFRKAAGNGARILILDNHDDFGGHAKRNEFTAGGRMLLSYGGTQSIESPGLYSAVAKQLDLGDRDRRRAVLQGVRPEALHEIWDGGVFRQRDVWRRPAADWIQYDAVAGVSGEGAAFGCGAARHRARLHRKSRLHGWAFGRAEAAEARVDQLRGLSDEILQGDAGCAEIFSDVSARFVWSGD